MNVETREGLRERKKAQTRRSIQEEGLRLFLTRGYEATTVREIADAAGVSHMTFFRYFSTKEDLVMCDDHDALISEFIASRPAGEPALEKVRHALKEGLTRVYAANRDALLARTRLIVRTPALRARLWEQQGATERLIVQALCMPAGDQAELRARVAASACLATMTTAVSIWAERGGAQELPDLIEEAFGALRKGLG